MNDKKEAVWFAVLAGIGILFLLLFYVTGRITAAHLATGKSSIPVLYWLLVAIPLLLCALVPILLRGSELFFRINAIVLTAVLPAVAIVFLACNLWYAMH